MGQSKSINFAGSNEVTPGQFEGKFLVAMPNMGGDRFEKSVIFLCAHSSDGAMGFQINRNGAVTISELIERSDLSPQGTNMLSKTTYADNFVIDGGPVDEHRGFVLHSDDFHVDATVPISQSVHLTSNVDVLRSMVDGVGPCRAVVSLGYSGWAAGQLEKEIAENVWLMLDADPAIIFDQNHDGKYEQLLRVFGIGTANFVGECGHA